MKTAILTLLALALLSVGASAAQTAAGKDAPPRP
jgi:hypothetical protein